MSLFLFSQFLPIPRLSLSLPESPNTRAILAFSGSHIVFTRVAILGMRICCVRFGVAGGSPNRSRRRIPLGILQFRWLAVRDLWSFHPALQVSNCSRIAPNSKEESRTFFTRNGLPLAPRFSRQFLRLLLGGGVTVPNIDAIGHKTPTLAPQDSPLIKFAMEQWHDFLPLDWDSSSCTFTWRHGLRCGLHILSEGPSVSAVRSGDTLADFLQQVGEPDAHPDAASGVNYYFDEVVEATEGSVFFEQTLPKMAELALRLPKLLVEQIELSEKLKLEEEGGGVSPSPLQILHPQQPGIILISQELAAALLSCAFLCLFPNANRDKHRLPAINMDTLFAGVFGGRSSQIHKIHCVLHYFHRVCESMPQGTISYERRVLDQKVMSPDFWSQSHTALCNFEIMDHGIIEDAGWEYAQVDFANKFLGGGVLRLGCVQEEIRFVLSPELLVGMLFLPVMAENETIEILGSERFSNYAGYGGKFRYAGDFVDSTVRDSWGRRCTKIIAMDAKARPGEAQFRPKLLLREVCKAYCGFQVASRKDTPESTVESRKYEGIATGNWGCGAFGGNLPIKSMLQWLAASEAGWPSVKYYTFQDQRAERLSEAVRFISENKYDVSHLWSVLLKYGELRQSQDVNCDFFTWLLKTPL